MENKYLLESFKSFLLNEIYPLTSALDTSFELMKDLFGKCKKANYFHLYVPTEYSGIILTAEDRIDLYEKIGQWGGAFGFLQTQTVIVSWLLQQSENNYLKEKYFFELLSNNLVVGNSLSCIKPGIRNGISSIKEKNGYRLSGKINFASGYKFFDELLIGFYIDNQIEAFTIVPFRNYIQNNGEIKIDSILDVAVMQSINTVSLSLEDFFIHNKDIIIKWPKNTLYQKYSSSPSATIILGIAISALNAVKESSTFNHRQNIVNGYHFLFEKVELYRNKVRQTNNDLSLSKLCAEIIYISWRCVEFSVLAAGGAGVLIESNVQRLYREIILWILQKTYPEIINHWLEMLYSDIESIGIRHEENSITY